MRTQGAGAYTFKPVCIITPNLIRHTAALYYVAHTLHNGLLAGQTMELFDVKFPFPLPQSWRAALPGLTPDDLVTTVNLPYQLMRRSLLPEEPNGNQAEADAVIHAGLGYYLLERTTSSAMAGGDNSIWTITKDPTADFCSSQDCGAHGTCVDLGVCECRNGYTGPECRDPPDLCKDSVPCVSQQ